MAADEAGATEPVTFAGGVLDPYRHVCAFVNDRGDEDAVLDAFVRQAIDGGDRLLYLVDPVDSAAPVNRLRRGRASRAAPVRGAHMDRHLPQGWQLRSGSDARPAQPDAGRRSVAPHPTAVRHGLG